MGWFSKKSNLSDEEKVRAEISQYEKENIKESILKNTLPFKINISRT